MDAAKINEAVEAVKEHGSITAAARAMGMSRTTLRDRYHASPHSEQNTKDVPPAPRFQQEESRTDRRIESVSHDVRTVQDALDKAEVDEAIWEVDHFTINSWEVAAKINDRMEARPLWQVKVWLKRRVSKAIEDASDKLIARMAKHAPKYTKLPRLKTKGDGYLLEISPFDAHFGKLAWAEETGSNYDLKIAQRVYREAMQDLTAKASAFPLEKILFVFGQDFFHINNVTGTTARGTRQDMDGRLAKVFDAGLYAMVEAIDYLMTIAPVEVVWVPGNHDPETSWYLAKVLKAWYRHCQRVEVDASPKSRKYRQYGTSLLGFTHGDKEAHRDLPTIMAGEARDLWAQTHHREWHLGHLHKRKETRHLTADSFGDVVVRILPSLCGTDAWHFEQGYVNGARAADAYLWGKANGLAAYFTSNIDKGAAA